MNVLAIDTSTRHAAIALSVEGGVCLSARPDPAARHGRNLVPAIRDLLREAGLPPRALGLIAVGLGPGSYTGLRVGLTAAKMLAYAAGATLAGFDSLEAIARNAPAEATRVSVIADAQRGDLYVADFARDAPSGPLLRVGPTRIEPIAAWADRLAGPTLVLGPGVERLPEGPPVAAMLPGDPRAHLPDGARLLELAAELARDGRRDEPWFLEPFYLRRSAAEDQWEAVAPPKPPPADG